MILACGTCTHWIVWTAFPAATPWAVTFAAWFLVLSLIATLSRVRLLAVPRFPAALALILGSLVLAVAIAGPLAGLWFAPSCLLGSASALKLVPQRRLLLSASAVAFAVLGALWIHSTKAYRQLNGTERVLRLEGTPAWPIELRRVGHGDCSTLHEVVKRASASKLVTAAKKRLAEECPRS